jgi:hypothetical protein
LWKLYGGFYDPTMSSIANMFGRDGTRAALATADRTGSRIQVLYRPVEDLKLDPVNPRMHTAQQVRQTARSIETFGFNVPVLVDTNLKVIAEHGRIMAAKVLGKTEIPTIQIDHLNEDQVRAFAIADNRLSEISTWDDRLLGEQLKALSEVELDFDLEVTGFAKGEIDLRIEGLEFAPEGAPDPADELPPVIGPQVSRAGDLWLLGRHRVYCGDALSDPAFDALTQGEMAAMVFTDPPYVKIDGNVSGLGAVQHREFKMASGEISESTFTAFLTRAFEKLRRYSNDGSIHYICMDWRHMGEFLAAGRDTYDELKNVLRMGEGQRRHGQLVPLAARIDFCLQARPRRAPKQRATWSVRPQPHQRVALPMRELVLEVERRGHLLALHPTVKPVAMVADAIMDVSAR